MSEQIFLSFFLCGTTLIGLLVAVALERLFFSLHIESTIPLSV